MSGGTEGTGTHGTGTHGTGTPDALGLAAALAERGVECVVEARDRLAVLFASDEWPAPGDAAERRALHRLATAYGFTHVALELDAGEAGTASDADAVDA